MIRAFVTLLVPFITSSSPEVASSQPVPIFPGTEWQEVSPESQGVDSEKLAAAIAYLEGETGVDGIKELVIIRNGCMIWKGADIDACHSIQSCTKTFTSTVLGLLIQDGKCTLDTLAVEHLPDLGKVHPLYSEIRFRHLASMTSGYKGQDGPITDEKPWGDPILHLTPGPTPRFAPGTKYSYRDDQVHLLGYIMTRMAGESLAALFKRRIADPIGMTVWDWKDFGMVDGLLLNNPSGIYEGGIHTTAREMARFGHLMLNRGNWDGAQLVDASWVDQATSTQVSASLPALEGAQGSGVYGFYWWTNGIKPDGTRAWHSAPSGTYAARGGLRNWCFVIPEWKMVVVRLGNPTAPRDPQHLWDTFFSLLKEAIQ